ncbi:3'-5' exonuclease [Photobacterium phosphoreum]|uniref:3'-5' exonuclease n=1 Tax=Photobacterium phosphoreum TaxID=659 RepID=UPI00242ACDC6|nr:3'-5' exonuclease [Photobacterium phosphoreum]
MVAKFNLKNVLLFDTETTGIGMMDEIIELGIINAETGEVLIDTYLKPLKTIPQEAINIHGITNEMVADAPTWLEIQSQLIELVYDKHLCAYNVDFDRRLFIQTAGIHGTDKNIIDYYRDKHEFAPCAMLWYAEFYGESSWKAGQFKWQKLTTAAIQQQIDFSDLTAHRAVSDCEIMRRVILKVNDQL